MLDEASFRKQADAALEALKRSLIRAEEEGDFETEEQSGALNIVFEEPAGKFVIVLLPNITKRFLRPRRRVLGRVDRARFERRSNMKQYIGDRNASLEPRVRMTGRRR